MDYIMKTLKESILADMDNIINKGDNDIYNIPSITDFEQDLYYKRNYFVQWWIPYVMQKYRSKYPELIKPGFDGIGFYIDTKWKELKLYLINNINNKKSLKIPLFAWDDTPINGKINNIKKEVIEMITKLAKNPKYLDRFFEQEYEDFEAKKLLRIKYINGDDLNNLNDEDSKKLNPLHDRNLKNLLK